MKSIATKVPNYHEFADPSTQDNFEHVIGFYEPVNPTMYFVVPSRYSTQELKKKNKKIEKLKDKIEEFNVINQ